MLRTGKHATTLRRVKEQYLYERNTNHVQLIWKADKAKEEAEYEREYREWLEQMEREEVEAHHLSFLRYGWREATRGLTKTSIDVKTCYEVCLRV